MNELNKHNQMVQEPLAFQNCWGPYVLHSYIEKSFAKKLLKAGEKIPVENDASKILASRIKKVRKYNIEKWIIEGLIPYTNKWINGWNKF